MSPASDKVRPTSDRAKETLFNILSNDINFEGIFCLDLFCGSGALGLECISRGAEMCYFVDDDVKLVKSNIATLNLENKCRVFEANALQFLDNQKPAEFSKIILVLCDPPYDYKHYQELLVKLSELKCIVVLEHSESFISPEKFSEKIYNSRKIGTVNFSFFNFN